MKKIEAIIQPQKLDDVKNALQACGVTGMTAYDVRGFGRQKGHTEVYRGAEYVVSFVPKTKIELVVPDELAPAVEDAILASAYSGTIGDGKVFTYACERAVRIRTGELGNQAL